LAAPVERDADSVTLTLAMNRADGIEKVALRVRIAGALLLAGENQTDEKIIGRMAPWLEREFETAREAALKSIRTERRLHGVVFDASNRGPF
jgi:hypothetical protein